MNEDVTLPNPFRFSGLYFRRQSILQRLFYDTVSTPILALVGPTVALTPRWKGRFTARGNPSVYMRALAHGYRSFTVCITGTS